MSHPKATTIKMFQNVQKHLALIGYRANQHPLNNQQLIYGMKIIWTIIPQCAYLLYVDNTQKEFIVSIFMNITAILTFISFLSTVQKMTTMFCLIDKCEKVINKSELTEHFILLYVYVKHFD